MSHSHERPVDPATNDDVLDSRASSEHHFLTRRRFLELGATVSAASLVGVYGGGTSSSSAASSPAAVPKRGGTLRWVSSNGVSLHCCNQLVSVRP